MNNAAHLTHSIQEKLGHEFYRVNNDSNGNPRYVIHYLAFASEYDDAREIANSIGFRVYRAREFGGGFVTQSYNIENHAELIIEARRSSFMDSAEVGRVCDELGYFWYEDPTDAPRSS